MSVVLPCLEFFFLGGYVTYVFLLTFVFGLLFAILRRC